MNTKSQKPTNLIAWVAQLVAAIIFAQTLFFKFTGAEESVYIFSALGVEPWGRMFAGFAELVSAVLLLHPKTHWLGAAQGLAIILGAIGAHLTVLGIEVQGDGGFLFSLAIVVALACALCLYLRRGSWLPVLQKGWIRFGAMKRSLAANS